MINVNDFNGYDDNEIIENAIKNKDSDGIVLIPPRESESEPERSMWVLDRAILIPENTTIILENCKIKLSDKCRDNFFRTANCGMGIEDPKKIHNIHIKGIGYCVLEGADHPRASGDGSKILANPCPYTEEDLCKYAYWVPDDRKKPEKLSFDDKHGYSYGTDAGKEGESQYGDWRGIGILFANADVFSIENIKIVTSHGWGISLEACTNGRVEKICFDACMSKQIDGMLHNMENQDGIDVRNGCHDIIISDNEGSASAIRNAVFSDRLNEAIDALPKSIYSSYNAHTLRKNALSADDFSLLLHFRLLTETVDSLCTYPDISPDLARRIKQHENSFRGFNDFAMLLKAKNLTYTHIKRCLLHIVLGIHKQDVEAAFNYGYVRMLGFRNAKELLNGIKKSSLVTLCGKPSVLPKDAYAKELFVSNLYNAVLSDRTGDEFVHEYKKEIIRISF